MSPDRRRYWIGAFAVVTVAMTAIAVPGVVADRTAPGGSTASGPSAPARPAQPVVVSATGLPSGRLIPTAAASADFDGNGIPDLAVVYRSDPRGLAVLYFGDPGFRVSTAPAGAPFLRDVRVVELDIAPDLAVAGDVNGGRSRPPT